MTHVLDLQIRFGVDIADNAPVSTVSEHHCIADDEVL